MPEKLANILKSTMGNSKSKHKGGKLSERSQRRDSSESEGDDFSAIFEEWADDHELKIMRRTIEFNPELFILNNLMMSIQFFENFDEEVIKMRQSLVSPREAEINSRLPPQKHVLIPDVLQEQVSRKVDFIYTRPSLIPSIEPLQPIRMYIVFDNVEVTEQSYTSPYSSVNETVTYSMQLKQSKHKGYALLQRLEVNPSKRRAESRDEAIYSDDDSVYGNKKDTGSDKKSNVSGNSSVAAASDINDEDSIYEERENLYGYDKKLQKSPKKQNPQSSSSGSPAGSTSSGYRSGNYTIDSDSDGGYALSPYRTSKVCLESGTMNSEIPRQCFTYTTEDKIYGVRKERRQKLNHKDRLIKGVMHSRIYEVWYLNSFKFMDYFYQMFTNQLAEPMGFDVESQDEPQGAVIYRDKLEVLESTTCMKDEQFAIIPCVWSTWPEIAHEWLDRPRGAWPEWPVIERIKEIGCYVIPEGYSSERSNNDLQNLEWELTFPAAERHLETCMSHAQVRVYVMALMLQKTFFRPIESVVGLTGSHIRNQLFWLIEEEDRPSKWSESRTGESLMKLLSSLYRAISQDVPMLPDYFIREKNLFQGKIYLLRTQKQLKRITENPVMYILHAMQNIRHSKKFFPKLDYSRLLRILTEHVLTLLNPELMGQTPRSMPRANGFVESEYEQTGGFWDTAMQKKEAAPVYRKKPVTRRSLIDAKTSSDQVVEIMVRCADLEPRRLCLLLDLFIVHFTKIAEFYHKYHAASQKMVYVEHAERLSVLLSEHASYRNAAKAHLEKLKYLKRRVISQRSQSDPPETPKRNSDRPVFTMSLTDRYKLPESQPILPIPESGESSNCPDGDSSVYKLNPPPRKQVTMAVVHEVDSETDSVELRSPQVKEVKKHRVVALTGNKDATSLSEDTYI